MLFVYSNRIWNLEKCSNLVKNSKKRQALHDFSIKFENDANFNVTWKVLVWKIILNLYNIQCILYIVTSCIPPKNEYPNFNCNKSYSWKPLKIPMENVDLWLFLWHSKFHKYCAACYYCIINVYVILWLMLLLVLWWWLYSLVV